MPLQAGQDNVEVGFSALHCGHLNTWNLAFNSSQLTEVEVEKVLCSDKACSSGVLHVVVYSLTDQEVVISLKTGITL